MDMLPRPKTEISPASSRKTRESDDDDRNSSVDVDDEDEPHVVSVDDGDDDPSPAEPLSSASCSSSSSSFTRAVAPSSSGHASSVPVDCGSPQRAVASLPTKTFAMAKRSSLGTTGGKTPPLRHGLGMQRSKAMRNDGSPEGIRRDLPDGSDHSANHRHMSPDSVQHCADGSDDDTSDHTSIVEDELTNETDEVTEDYDMETGGDDISDDDTFSEGTMGEDSPFPARIRRSMMTDRSAHGEDSTDEGRSDGHAASPQLRSSNSGPIHTNKALKLLGLQESQSRTTEATDLFNSAAMSPLDLEGSPKKKGSIRAFPGKITRTGDKMKMRTNRKDASKLSGRSQSDSRLDVIDREGSPAMKLTKGAKQRTSIKNMRASIKSQFSADGKRVGDVNATGTQFTSKLFAKAFDDDDTTTKRIVGSIDNLIDLLFDPSHIESDKEYELDFFNLYRFFIKPKTLLKKFIEMYRKQPDIPPDANLEMVANSESQRLKLNRRIIELIQTWTKMGFDDLNEDANFMQKLTFFINNVMSPQERTESKINVELTQLIERKNAVYKKQKEEEELAKARFIPLRPDQCNRVKKMARLLNFLEQRTKEVVEELTYIERSLFVAIKPWEFLAVLWNSSPPTPDELKRQPNYNKWEEHKKQLENWVVSEIITRPDLNERTLALKKFIDISRFAYKNGNLNCVHTIITALLSPSIKRLTKTWSNLPGKSVAAFDKLCARVNEGEQTDYQAYTNLLKEGRTLPFILPSLSVFARELSSLKAARRENELGEKAKIVVDFSYLRRATVIMQEVQGYQQRGTVALTSRPILNKFLRQHHRSLPENVIFYFSLHCESEEDGTSKDIHIDTLDPGLVYAITAGRFYVKSGIPKALSAKVMDKWLSSLDPDYRDAVILNRAYWLSAVELFDRLTECYPKQAPLDTWGMFKETELQLADVQDRLRTIDAIRFWMEIEMNELRNDEAFVRRLQEFVNSTYFINSNEACFFLQLKETFKPVRPPPPTSILPNIAQTVPGLSEKAGTCEYPLEEKIIAKTFPRELAECITIIDQTMLKAIPPKELVRKAYTKPEKSPNMAAMVNHFNSISNWVATVIVMETNLQRRAQILIQFILAAWECRLIQNFNGSYAIVAALNNAAISRLKQTWALVPARVLGRWKELEFLFDYPGAFRNYREAIAKTKPPVIPFLANYSKNLFGIEENNLVYIEEGIVNFERFVMLVSQIRDLQTYQQYSYPFTVDPNLYDYLVEGKNKMTLSEDEFYELSQEREGKVTHNPDDPSSLATSGSVATVASASASPALSRASSPSLTASGSTPTREGMVSSLPLAASPSTSDLASSSPLSSRGSSPLASARSQVTSAPSSPLFKKLARVAEEQPDPTLKQLRNPIFGARLPSGSSSPATPKRTAPAPDSPSSS